MNVLENCIKEMMINLQLTKVNKKLVKVCTWYDNEWGFSTRMVDMLKLMGK